MNDTVETTSEVKAPAPTLEIIRGRMPAAVVALVRFGNLKGETTAVKAKRFGTTVGKIDDIAKGRNFAYIKEDFAPTQAQKDEGIAWLKTHPRYDADNVDALIMELDATPVATDEQAAAFAAARTAARGVNTTNADGTPANAGGGNRRGKSKAPKVEGGEEAAPAADALLS